MRLAFGFLLVAAAFGAPQDFNGRWDITVASGSGRAWWVELNGVGTASPSGKFVSAYGGDMNTITTITAHDDELTFTIDEPHPANAPPNSATRKVYHAKLVGGKLQGTFEEEGRAGSALRWTGVRAPTINEKDDGTWKEGTPIQLFNGKDLSGWKALHPDVPMKWTVQDAILRNSPPTTDIISERKFWNFKLHVDFRIVQNSNSGIGLRGRYEIQVLDDYGKAPQSHGAAAL